MQEIIYLPISKLKSHPENPRKVEEKQMTILCESLKANPDYFETRPILCNKDFVVFAGNMRLLAAKKNGLTDVPVAVMDISEERQKEIMIRDNRSNGIFDFDILANTFEIPDLLKFGFEEKELLGNIFAPAQENDTQIPDNACARCLELQQATAGHEKRSQHKVVL